MNIDSAMLTRAKELIYDKIKSYQGVSFVEIENLLQENNIVTERDPEFIHHVRGIHPNVVLWLSDNEYVTKAVTELVAEKQIFPQPTNPMIYLIDGKCLALPLIRGKGKKNGDYKDPHWLPVAFNSYPKTRVNKNK